ncbi:DUF6454 family protein [Streptomyces lavendofoliae]|uniref:DUF6454 family protein n=1 Tax=Streptomyces lavendofoliae TaxID=67314 RepID=UPI003D8B5388
MSDPFEFRTAVAGRDDSNDAIVTAARQLSRSTVWTMAGKVPFGFTAHHPQGITRGHDDRLYLSTAEIIEATQRYDRPVDGYDRTPGRGVGHVFVTDAEGAALGHVTVGEGTVYHPGGIDFDGESLWVPTAEYRPDSRSIVYRVDPGTLAVTEAFRFEDHIGGIVRAARPACCTPSHGGRGVCSPSPPTGSSSTGPTTRVTSSTTRRV